MGKAKKAVGIILALLLMFLSIPGYDRVSAAKKEALPQVSFVTAPVTEYTEGDRVRFDINAPNYGGKVEYRVVLWEDSRKTAHDLWNAENGYPNRYYTKWQPYGNNTFTLGWPVNEPGTYRITVYVKRVGVANSKTALKGMNCDSYKESVAFVVKPKDQESAVLLDKPNQSYGSSDSNKPEAVKGDVRITGNNITYSNADIEGNLYISADNALLNNINVKETLFIDPGKDGSAVLNNVRAKNIKVISGAQNSIHLKDVITENLSIASISKVRIVTEGTTKITGTSVTSSAVLDNREGTFGTVTVSKGQNGKSEVEFSGTFSESVNVNAEAVIKAGQGTNIAKLIIALENKGDTAVLQGSFNSVEISKESRLSVDGDIKNLDVKAKSSIDTTSNTNIEALNKNGNEVEVSGSGKVAQEAAANTGTSGSTVSTGGAAGGGTLPAGGTPIPPLAVESAGVVLSNGTTITAGRVGSTGEFFADLSGYESNIGVRTSFTVNKDCVLEIMGKKFQFAAHTPRVFGPADFGMEDNDPPGISLGNLRSNFADAGGFYTDSVTLNESANQSISITIKMKVK